MACTAVVRPVDDPNEYLPHLPSSDSNIVSSTVPLGPFDDLVGIPVSNVMFAKFISV